MNTAPGHGPSRKVGPWEALGIVAVLMGLILGFFFVGAAIIKWVV